MIGTRLILLIFAVGANGWLFDGPKPDWDKLSATFLKFSSLPQNVDDAKNSGWVKTDSCQDHEYFLGNRYVYNNDPSIMLLFDSNGRIAGIQNGIQKSSATDGFYQKPYWVEDGDLLVVTAYFADPKLICTGKREVSTLIGDSLYIQNGANPSSVMKIPLEESGVGKTKWVKGKCVYGMGQHYWYDISTQMNCDDYFPSFLLYNGGKLNAFGWVSVGDFQSSRYEHPPTYALKYFFQPESMPSCIKNFSKLSTIHIYFQRRPYLNFC